MTTSTGTARASTAVSSTDTVAGSSGLSPTGSSTRLPAGYQYEWNRFLDWCTATDHTALPAHPVTVAEFLDDHPAPPGTQRRRLAAVTAAHTTAGHPSPARAAAIRALLHPVPDGAPGEAGFTADQTRRVVDDVLTHLPTVGWPHGLFGRRDALLLVLTHAGLGPTAAVRLHRADATTTPDRELAITTGPFDQVLLAPTDDTRTCPTCVFCRWAQVLTSTDTDPTRRTLRADLHTASPATATSPHPCAQPGPAWSTTAGGYPLLTSVDGWGWLPWAGTGLTPRAAAHLVTAHLTGTSPTHRTLTVPTPAGTDPAGTDPAGTDPADGPATDLAPPPPPAPPATAAQRAADAAVAIRRRRDDQAALNEASDALAGLDARVQLLLQQTLDLLEGTPSPSGRAARG